MNGIDYLGGANYERLILDNHPSGWAAGFILTTNDPQWPKNRAWPVIRKLLATGRCPRVRVHGVWRDTHGYVARRDDPIIFRQLRKANEVQAEFPGAEIQFSPFCEHNIRGAALRNLIDRLKAQTSLTLVNSVYKGDLVGDIMNEVHGDTVAPASGRYIYSFDGTSAYERDVKAMKRAHRRADTFYLWIPQMNGRAHTKDPTPRNLRKSWPTPDDIRKLVASVR